MCQQPRAAHALRSDQHCHLSLDNHFRTYRFYFNTRYKLKSCVLHWRLLHLAKLVLPTKTPRKEVINTRVSSGEGVLRGVLGWWTMSSSTIWFTEGLDEKKVEIPEEQVRKNLMRKRSLKSKLIMIN